MEGEHFVGCIFCAMDILCSLAWYGHEDACLNQAGHYTWFAGHLRTDSSESISLIRNCLSA